MLANIDYQLHQKEPCVHPLLAPFISSYVYRTVQMQPDAILEKSMPLRTTNSIDFFIGDAYDSKDCLTGEQETFQRTTIRGPRTYKKYAIQIKGHFIVFNIKFHPTGLFRLFGVPMDKFTDQSVAAGDTGILPFDEMKERLLYAPDIASCIKIVEPYLVKVAAAVRGKHAMHITENAARNILQQKGMVNINDIAAAEYLSLRQLERNFIQGIGVSPKVYARMHRFEHLLQCRAQQPGSKWASLAQECSYFDQMHLVKEFKHFLGITPSMFAATDFAM